MTSRTDWNAFTVARGQRPDAIAALCAFFYFDRPVRAIAPEVAEIIDRYVRYVGIASLSMFAARSGLWKEMSSRQLEKDLKHLRNFPSDHVGAHIAYDSQPVPGPFGVSLFATELVDSMERRRDNLLRLELPVSWTNERTEDDLVGCVADWLALAKVQHASAGLAFKRTEGSMHQATPGVHRLLPRYLGFDPCYSNVRDSLRDHILTAHWLNFIDNDLVGKLGGQEAAVKALPGCELRWLESGLLIRSARRPPVGDINHGAPDIGRMPDVARYLRPIRVTDTGFGDPRFDVDGWLSRLDDLPSQAWDNSDVA